MAQPVLLDNTVLTNFALVDRAYLGPDLWPGACTTPAVKAEYAAGVQARDLNPDAWQRLNEVSPTLDERAFAERLRRRLGAGERSCIAVAHHRKGLFASDDYDARREAQAHGIPTTGTIGILLLAIRRRRITLESGNALLAQLIESGYRSPVDTLDEFL